MVKKISKIYKTQSPVLQYQYMCVCMSLYVSVYVSVYVFVYVYSNWIAPIMPYQFWFVPSEYWEWQMYLVFIDSSWYIQQLHRVNVSMEASLLDFQDQVEEESTLVGSFILVESKQSTSGTFSF